MSAGRFLLGIGLFFVGFGATARAEEVPAPAAVAEAPDNSAATGGFGDLPQEEIAALCELWDMQTVTTSRRAQKLSRAPAVVRIITRQEIQDRGYKDLKDVFVDLPGFDVSQNLSGEVRTLGMVRGMIGEQKLMVMRNGHRLNATTGERLVIGNNMPLFDVERIEVVYGPSSAVYGADAYSGTINLITRDFAKDGAGQVDLAYGNQSTKDVGLFASRELVEGVEALASFRFFDSAGVDPRENHPEFAVKTLYEQPVRDYNLDLRLRIGELTIGFYRMDAKEPGGPNTNLDFYTFDKSYIWWQKQNWLYFEHRKAGDSWDLVTTAGYEDYEIDPSSNFWYGPDGFDIGHQYKYARNQGVQVNQQLNAELASNWNLTAGWMAEAVSAFAKGNNLNEPFGSDTLVDEVTYPDDPAIPEEFRGKTIRFGAWPYYSAGLYAETTWAPLESLQLNAGGRFDYNTDYDGVFTPRAGIIWNPTAGTNIKALYSTASLKPSRYLALEHWSAGGNLGVYPNYDLQPEKLTTVSLGVEQLLFKDVLRLSIYPFFNRITNLIQVIPVDSLWQQNGNQGTANSWGAELTSDWKLPYGLTAHAYYSFLDAKQANGQPMNKVARHKGNLGLNWTWNRLSLSPRLHWSSKVVRLDPANPGQTAELPGFYVVDFTARVRRILQGVGPISDLSAYFTMRNTLDRAYYTAAPFGESGWQLNRAAQPGVNGELGLTLEL